MNSTERRRYLVTGDRGFVGGRLTRRLLAAGHDVVGADIRPGSDQDATYEKVVMDLSDGKAVQALLDRLDGLDGVFHLAARLPANDNDSFDEHIQANLRPTENLLKAVHGRQIPIVISSTMSVYGMPPERIPVSEEVLPSPVEPYGLCKLAGECAAERMATSGRARSVVLRYSGIFGEGYNYGAIHLYATLILQDRPIEVYASGTLVRDYVHVDDVIQANMRAMDYLQRANWGLFHIGGGEPRQLLDIARFVRDAFGTGEIKVNDRPGTFDFGFDIRAAREGLGYAPAPLRDRIQQYVDALKSSPPTGGKTV